MPNSDEARAHIEGLIDLQERVAAAMADAIEATQQLKAGALLVGLDDASIHKVRETVNLSLVNLEHLNTVAENNVLIRQGLDIWWDAL